MTPIQTNKHVFFDDEGNVLEGGSIWVGQPNVDPRTNPKTVTFTDAGGSTFTAAQPMKTKAGRISYNGKPIEATVDGEYSMLVFDSSGKQTDYYRSINVDGGGTVADFAKLVRVGLTLSDVKGFDVSVGDLVTNVGKLNSTDGKGRTWIARSATGNPADDQFLIDFDNGLQGSVVDNVIYRSPESVWTGSASAVPMIDTDDPGDGEYTVITSSYRLDVSVVDYGVTTTGLALGTSRLFTASTSIIQLFQCIYSFPNNEFYVEITELDLSAGTSTVIANEPIIEIKKA